jgi:EpsD family peptidyl-prolyl cis-trans isomerase
MLSEKQSIAMLRRLGICAIASIALIGCTKKDEANSAASNSQIVARVGDQVVSAQELDTELRWNNVAADRTRNDAVVKRVLSELVTRKYLLQKSLAAKLDREPTVLLDILRSREQVLAKAFMTRELTRQAGAITITDTEKYIRDHPLKFADRKILAIEQISFALASADKSTVESVTELTSLEKADQRLTELGLAHTRSLATLSTSEIPDDLLRAVQEKKQGEVIFFRSGQNGVLLSIRGEERRPLEGDAAVSVAQQLQQQELAKAQASLVSFTANMEASYQGEYAKVMGENKGLPDTN